MAPLDCPEFFDWPWQQWATQRPDAVALVRGQKEISWRRLADEVNALCDRFYQSGVREGQGVALRGKNGEELLLAYLAVLQLGARVLPLNPQLPESLLAELLPSLDIHYGWCAHNGVWHSAIVPLSPFSAELLSCDYEGGYDTSYASWPCDSSLTMTLTSGSSGLPKAVVHRPTAHLANARGLLQRMTFDADDRWLLSLPLFHVSGQGILWRWLFKGATLVQRDMHPLSDALSGCTHASLVPTQLWRLLEQSASGLALKQVLLGGATIPVELTARAQQAGISCWCGYGMTEMASTACAKQADASAGVGVPLPGREIRIVRDEIWLKGSGQALGYWQKGHVRPLTDAEGWYHTRDRGEVREGELFVQGRLDNLFFSGGEGIQPEDIERALATHPAVHQAFVVPVDSAEFGQRPVAVIDSDIDFDIARLSVWLEDKVPRFQIPDAYYLLPESLKQGGIKISRQAVKEWVRLETNS